MPPTKVRQRGEQVRRFILESVESAPTEIARLTAERFGITRQAANKHLRKLVAEGALAEVGETRGRAYLIQPLIEWWEWYPITETLAEDLAWRQDVAPLLEPMPGNVLDLWHYGFTEMFNNAIEHSGGTMISVYVERTATNTTIRIYDNGVGIFKKIQQQFHLEDESHAVLELAKGKLTTDPAHHTGEGIFFTSRMIDKFNILSGSVYFSHQFGQTEDWVMADGETSGGTQVSMRLSNYTSRTPRKIFDAYTSKDGDYGFTKTVIPVHLAQYGEDKLVSRSQAKRMLVRVDRFKTVVLNFEKVGSIGQAFADEIFRVFANAHPDIELIEINTTEPVRQMISRARAV
jgi:STAS-like domain of unknown function (DUF4325)